MEKGKIGRGDGNRSTRISIVMKTCDFAHILASLPSCGYTMCFADRMGT